MKRLRSAQFPLRSAPTPRGIEPRPTASRTGANFDTAWSRRWAPRMVRGALIEGPMRLGVAALAAPTRRGVDRLDGVEGPLIFAANHHSHLDTPLLLTQIPEPWRHQLAVAAAADYFFKTRLTGTAAALGLGAIPIERAKVGRTSADLAAELLADGWSLLIFPEGGRSPDGWAKPFRGGAAYLSSRCDVPVVPIHIEGTGRILRKGASIPRRSATTITFGSPILAAEGENNSRFGDRIESTVAALADETSSDWYSARKRAHAGETPSLSGPTSGTWRRAWAATASSARRTQPPEWPKVSNR